MKIDLHNYEAYLLDYLEGNLNESDLNELKNFAVLHPDLNIDLGKNELPYFSKDDLSSDFKAELFKSEENLPDERVIAYVEGTLSETEKQKFEQELAADKTLLAELTLYKQSILKADKQIVFENKHLLLKNEDEMLLSNPSLLFIEGLLQGDEKIAFESQVKSNPTLKAELELFAKAKLAVDLEIVHPDKESLKKKSKVIILFSTRNVVAIAAAILLIVGLGIVFNNLNSDPTFKKELSNKNNQLPKNNIEYKINNDSLNSTERIKQIVPQKVYVASKNVKVNKTINENKDSLNINETPEQNKNMVNNEKPVVDIINAPINKSDSMIVSNKVDEKNEVKTFNSTVTKQTTLLAYESDDEIVEEENQKKSGFWNRAARLAKQANELGVKAINGEDRSGEKFMISFKAFSIEKK